MSLLRSQQMLCLRYRQLLSCLQCNHPCSLRIPRLSSKTSRQLQIIIWPSRTRVLFVNWTIWKPTSLLRPQQMLCLRYQLSKIHLFPPSIMPRLLWMMAAHCMTNKIPFVPQSKWMMITWKERMRRFSRMRRFRRMNLVCPRRVSNHGGLGHLLNANANANTEKCQMMRTAQTTVTTMNLLHHRTLIQQTSLRTSLRGTP